MFGLSREDTRINHTEYTEKWKVAMKDANELARQDISKSADDGKKQYDRKVRFSILQPGDLTFVRNLSDRRRPRKLRSHWEQEVHLIVEQNGEEKARKANLEYSTEISFCLVISCKLICQNLFHNVHKRRQGQFLLTKEARFISMVVIVGMRGSYLASHPPSWKCFQHQQQKQTIMEQENMDNAQEYLLPNDMDNLTEHGEDTPVTKDCSPSDSETDQEPLLQQAPAGSHYPVRNRHPPNILCCDNLGNPSSPTISTLSTPATTANVSVYSPWLPVTP